MGTRASEGLVSAFPLQSARTWNQLPHANYICSDIILLIMGQTSFFVTLVRICVVILAFWVHRSPCMFDPLSESEAGEHRGSFRCFCEARGLSSPGQVSRRELVTSSGTRRLHSGRCSVGLVARPWPALGCPFVAPPFCPSRSGAQRPEKLAPDFGSDLWSL